ncbi:shikimate kinase [Aequorivita capsosiphonis]|uniref:shikimate kinase n=1 Tax=Aequorivita capsosiphonis TaxID=487317 RepID=UPI0003F6EABA|nr:shikimate kinase [Aequorivita capsosiphonis]
MKIVLIGYMGSGKSTVGKKLAEVLGIPFMDLDTEIEKQTNTSISEIFSKKGEIYFRRIESEVLKKLLSQSESYVLATGGGTPCYGDNMAFMTKADLMTIYLKTPLDVLTSRLFLEKESRPLLAHLKTRDDLNDFLRKHLFERVYYYNQSKYVVETIPENIEETVEKIVLKLF